MYRIGSGSCKQDTGSDLTGSEFATRILCHDCPQCLQYIFQAGLGTLKEGNGWDSSQMKIACQVFEDNTVQNTLRMGAGPGGKTSETFMVLRLIAVNLQRDSHLQPSRFQLKDLKLQEVGTVGSEECGVFSMTAFAPICNPSAVPWGHKAFTGTYPIFFLHNSKQINPSTGTGNF